MNLSGVNLKGVAKMRLHLRAGRTTVTAISLAAAVAVMGGIVLSHRASAQTTRVMQGRISTFGPFQAPPVSANSDGVVGGSHGLAAALLPAVQRLAVPFRLQVINEDANLVIPIAAPAGTPGRSGGMFDIYTQRSAASDGLQIHVKNRRTGEEVVQDTAFMGLTVRFLPAVQFDGRVVSPISDSTTLFGVNNVQMGDGSVLPIPFQNALPAVQDVAIIN